jgi:hypothetical protein
MKYLGTEWKKGWIRIHVILSILFMFCLWPFMWEIARPYQFRFTSDYFIVGSFCLLSCPLYWVLIYLIKFLIKWVKQGFK